jgi:hypothetical protein
MQGRRGEAIRLLRDIAYSDDQHGGLRVSALSAITASEVHRPDLLAVFSAGRSG